MNTEYEMKFYGPEPMWIDSFEMDSERRLAIGKALNWYSYMATDEDRKNWLVDWMKLTSKPEEDIKLVEGLSSKEIIIRFGDAPETEGFDIGVFCRLMANKAPLDDKDIKEVDRLLPVILRKARRSEATPKRVPVKDIQESLRILATEYAMQINEQIDAVLRAPVPEGKGRKPAPKFEYPELKPSVAQRVLRYYKDIAAEFKKVMEKEDAELVETYSIYPEYNIKNACLYVQGLLELCEKGVELQNATKVGVRRKRRKSPVDIVKNLQFKKEDTEFKLVSILPTQMVDAQKIVVFNTKYRTISYYEADSANGISVKGTTLTQFDPKKSKTKIVRKPEEFLAEIKGKGIRVFKSAFDKLTTTEKEATGRINDETILLAVY